jgi:hypothetical protein
MSMIKLVRIAVAQPPELDLTFSDGSTGRWSASHLVARSIVSLKSWRNRTISPAHLSSRGRLPGRTASSCPEQACTAVSMKPGPCGGA